VPAVAPSWMGSLTPACRNRRAAGERTLPRPELERQPMPRLRPRVRGVSARVARAPGGRRAWVGCSEDGGGRGLFAWRTRGAVIGPGSADTVRTFPGDARSCTSEADENSVFSGGSWCRRTDLNRGPTDYESVALPLSYVGSRTCYSALALIEATAASGPLARLAVVGRPDCSSRPEVRAGKLP
jgi:hypothetical protein